eukprot:SAG22_NODE_5643_length_978_cov_1.439135_2_plen_54_part_01
MVALQAKKPVVVTGDLNVAHHNIDIYNYFKPHMKKVCEPNRSFRHGLFVCLFVY